MITTSPLRRRHVLQWRLTGRDTRPWGVNGCASVMSALLATLIAPPRARGLGRGRSPQRLPPLIQAGSMSGSGAAESVRLEQSQH
jgi:hypothetical protein